MKRPAAVQKSKPDPEAMRGNALVVAKLLKAMAHECRLMVLCALADCERSVGEINAIVDLSQSALSQHLAVLRREGLVATRRESQMIYYRIASPEAAGLIRYLYKTYCG